MRVIVCGIRAKILCVVAAVLLIFSVIAPFLRTGKAAEEGIAVPILMYHSVGYNSKIDSPYLLSPEVFEEDLAWLNSHGYRTVFVRDLADYVDGIADLPEKASVITLDDGYLNNLTYVLPLLEKYDCRAVISVVGAFTERYSSQPDPNPAYAHLTWDDLQTLSASGRIEIGNHTYNMHSLSGRRGCLRKSGESETAYRAALSSDLSALQRELSDRCDLTSQTFAYPYGAVDGAAESVLKSLGFRAALTCTERVNFLSVGDRESLYSLGRFNRPSGEKTEDFMRRVFGEK